jgi:hypothetical protein
MTRTKKSGILFIAKMKEINPKDRNVFKKIFQDNWEAFKIKNSKYATDYYEDIVTRMINCGDPEKMGFLEYQCTACGQCSRKVSMSCKSTMCLSCGKVYVDNWVSQVSKVLHEGVIYRHIVLTVPEIFRITFYNNAQELLGKLMKIGATCLDDYYSEILRKEVRGGYIIVLQTHGRNGQYNVHLHIIATSGGLNKATGKWEHIKYMPYPLFHKKWQWYLLEMLRREVDTERMEKMVDYCYKKYPEGFVANIQKGTVPSGYQSLAKYVAKYVVSPPISVKRINEYDGKEVTYQYKSHKTDRIEKETVSVEIFIGRMIQHVMPKGFKRIRYYGVQATKSYEKIKNVIKAATDQIIEKIKDCIQIIIPQNYRERYAQSRGVDPIKCPCCGEEMELWKIWNPKYGVIYSLMNELKWLTVPINTKVVTSYG